MALVPMDMLSRMQVSAQTDGTLAQLGQLNKNIESSLKQTHLPPDVQAKLFNQEYQQFQAFKNAQLYNDRGSHNIRIPIVQDDPLPGAAQPPPPPAPLPPLWPDGGPPPLWAALAPGPAGAPPAGAPLLAAAAAAPLPALGPPPQRMAAAAAAPGTYKNVDEIVRNIPASAKPVARVLFKFIGRNNRIDWDGDTGLVSIDGQPIRGSNMKDIIDDLSRDYREKGPVDGSMEVGIAMAETDMPNTYFGNYARRSQIHSAVHRRRPLPQPYPAAHQLNYRQFPDDDDNDSARRTSSPLKKQASRRSPPQTGSGLPFLHWETLYPMWATVYK